MLPPRLILLLRRLVHFGVNLLGGAVIVVCLLALGFKFLVMPNLDHFKPMITGAASRALGVPVTLGALEADWVGINPRITLRNFAIQADQGTPLLLPVARVEWSWFSLALLEPRLAALTLEQPRLAVRRDPAGVLHVGGITLDPAAPPSPFPDWLLRQPNIIVRDAMVSWLDEKVGAPELRFEQIRLLLRNRFGHHHFGGVALPSAAAARLELRGDLKGDAARDLASWSGQIYARVDRTDFKTWSLWVPWAQEAVKTGSGDLRFWLDLDHGQVSGLTGDTLFHDVTVHVDEDLADLVFQKLAGRIGWAREFDRAGQISRNTFFVDRLRFSVAGETPSEPASVRVVLNPDGKGGYQRVFVYASNLRLEALTALTGALPLPRRGHDLIEALNPSGLVESAEGQWAGANDYAVKLRVRSLGLNPYQAYPGISGVSARIEADQTAGSAEINGLDMGLNLGKVFHEPLLFNQFGAHATWKRDAGNTHVTLEEVILHNADLDATAQGSIDFPAAGAPRVDLKAQLTRGEATAVYRYLPYEAGEATYHWVKAALLGGHSDDARLVLRGDLSHFPFDKGGGEFKVAVKMVDGALEYAEGWPRIEGINGMLVFHDKAMDIHAESGRILGARLGPVRVNLPDLMYTPDKVLMIDGQASGESQEFLEFIRRSPINQHTGGFTEPFKAVGNGELSLILRLPLTHIDDSGVSGVYSVRDNRLAMGGELPELEAINGRLTFSEKTVAAKDMHLRVFDLPATLAFETEPGGKVEARLNGMVTVGSLRPHLPASLADRLSGACDWRAEVRLGGQHNEIQVNSDLAGLAVALPAPFGKDAATRMPLSITRKPDAEGSVVKARYGKALALHAVLPTAAPARISARLFQGEAPPPSEAGISVSGALAMLDLDAWRGLQGGSGGGAGGGGTTPPLRSIDLALREARAGGMLWHDTRVRAHPSGRGWNVDLAGREIAGDVQTLPEANGLRVIANLKHLTITPMEAGIPGGNAAASTQALSSLELNALAFAWKGRELGELHLRLSPDKGGNRIDHLSLRSPDALLEAKGLVSAQGRRPTRLEVNLESQNLGKLLTQHGYPGAVRGGVTKVGGNVEWMGGLGDFRLADLGGNLAVSVKRGQFIKADPGVAKLLGILSLQALPRRITLDFRDIFSEGFAFDEFVGNVYLQRGSAYLKNLKINGPAAKVTMNGVIDLVEETQNLRVGIQPRLDDTLTIASALLGGPVVGLGAYIANKVLNDPLGQAVRFEYGVSGTWADPVIAKIKREVVRVVPEP
jgi:uncharacterized protein (TIGR02099 family)